MEGERRSWSTITLSTDDDVLKYPSMPSLCSLSCHDDVITYGEPPRRPSALQAVRGGQTVAGRPTLTMHTFSHTSTGSA